MHVNAVVGQHLNITCKYPNRHRERPKFFCREADAIGCRYTFTSQDSRAKTDPGLYSLHDNRERSILVVSFRNVTKHHGGHYWCGVEVNWESGGYKAFITNVSLSVKGNNRIVFFFFQRYIFTDWAMESQLSFVLMGQKTLVFDVGLSTETQGMG